MNPSRPTRQSFTSAFSRTIFPVGFSRRFWKPSRVPFGPAKRQPLPPRSGWQRPSLRSTSRIFRRTKNFPWGDSVTDYEPDPFAERNGHVAGAALSGEVGTPILRVYSDIQTQPIQWLWR